MHKKRDRTVMLYLHRVSRHLLLVPYVYYMAGECAAFGDPVELADPADLGKQLVRLLRACKKADLEAMKSQRMEQLRSYWRGEGTPKPRPPLPSWQRLLAKYPALAKGPGTYLRQFAVCQVFERDGWNCRQVVRVEKSEYRGCTNDGDIQRIALNTGAKALGQQVLEFLES